MPLGAQFSVENDRDARGAFIVSKFDVALVEADCDLEATYCGQIEDQLSKSVPTPQLYLGIDVLLLVLAHCVSHFPRPKVGGYYGRKVLG